MPAFSFRYLLRWHLLLWLVFFAYKLLGDYLFNTFTRFYMWLDGSFTLACMAVFYFCYLLVLPWALQAGRLWRLAVGLPAAVLVFMAVRYGIEEIIYPATLGFHNYQSGTSFQAFLFDGIYYTIPNAAFSAALWAGETALRRERENQQLSAEKRIAELSFLKIQLNPHFLYNTLNALFSQAYTADKNLANSLMKLSELMRYMLCDTPDGLVDLSEELNYLENFLALYRLRYPGRLYAELTVQGDPAGHRVAPLLLIPFVENAFKHGVLDDPATPVQMHLSLGPATLEFTVENHRHDYQTDATSGLGLANLRRRLELLYPGHYTLAVGPMGEQFRTFLRLTESVSQPVTAAALRPITSAEAVAVPA